MSLKLYDFKCYECGLEYEKLTRLTDKQECPKCGSGRVERVYTKSQFKVGGVGTHDSRMKCGNS